MEQKRLQRSRNERKISGVCGGIAEYFEVDPTLVRLIFVLAVLLEGIGLIAYLVLSLVVPEAPEKETVGSSAITLSAEREGPVQPQEPPVETDAAESLA